MNAQLKEQIVSDVIAGLNRRSDINVDVMICLDQLVLEHGYDESVYDAFDELVAEVEHRTLQRAILAAKRLDMDDLAGRLEKHLVAV